MATSNIDICARALVMIGAAPITSFADGTTEATVAANLYEDTVRDLISRNRWRFAAGQAQLSRRTDAPDAKWDAAYQLPSNLLLLHDVTVNGDVIDYDRYQDLVYCDADEADLVYADYTFRALEDLWPPYFTTAVELTLASIFAYAVANQIQTADYMEKKALRQMALARNIDSQAQTTRAFDLSRFEKARRTIR
jgi:hypothetical protein